jgi:hypothetical protein
MFKLRHLLLAGILLAAMKSNACHIDYYVSNGCLGTTSVTIDAYQVATPWDTYYQWQYRVPGGSWTFLTSATQTINGQSYVVTGATGGGSTDNPDLVITKTATSTMQNLDGVEVRVLMRVGSSVGGNTGVGTSIAIYNGDDEDKDKTKALRLTYNPTACGTSCLNNLINNASGYYGGFEQVGYSSGSFTDNNFGFGEGDTDYSSGGSFGGYKVLNNPYAFSPTFAAFAPHSGNYQMVVKGNSTNSSRAWYQSITPVSGYEYTFSVWVARVDGTQPQIKLYANSTLLVSSSITAAIGNWVQVSGSYVATSTTPIVFSVQNGSASSGADNWSMDDICLTKQLATIDIGDFVWFDVNRNGTQDAGEPGVSGVTVQLFPDANNDGGADGAATATTTTNASGNYLFTVPMGEYFVKVTLPAGYTAFTTQNVGAAGTNSAVNASGQTGTHDFTADYLMKDAGVVKNITISGTAFNDPTALVDNTVNGTPISAAGTSQLYANLFKTVGSVHTFVASAAIAGGTYTFSNLPGNTNYTVAISTVAAIATTTVPASVLPSGWMNAGENIGTAAGSDGTANGIIAVSLLTANIGNVNFGMQTPPTANVVTLTPQPNPGGNSFITIPATNFGGTDAGGAISFIKITSFPTNATSIKLNGTDYTAGNIGIAPNIPTNAAGQPTQPIAIDPVDGNVSVVIPYKTIDNGGAQSSNTGSVTVPVVVPPDLSPLIVASPTVMNGITNFNITIKVSEVNGTATNGLITVLVPKDPRISFTYNSTMTTLGATPVNNANWTLNNTNQFFYIFTSTTVIPASGFSTIGLAAQFDPMNAQGVYVLSSVISSGSGGEVRTSNNSSSVSLTYFPN